MACMRCVVDLGGGGGGGIGRVAVRPKGASPAFGGGGGVFDCSLWLRHAGRAHGDGHEFMQNRARVRRHRL